MKPAFEDAQQWTVLSRFGIRVMDLRMTQLHVLEKKMEANYYIAVGYILGFRVRNKVSQTSHHPPSHHVSFVRHA